MESAWSERCVRNENLPVRRFRTLETLITVDLMQKPRFPFTESGCLPLPQSCFSGDRPQAGVGRSLEVGSGKVLNVAYVFLNLILLAERAGYIRPRR